MILLSKCDWFSGNGRPSVGENSTNSAKSVFSSSVTIRKDILSLKRSAKLRPALGGFALYIY